MAYGSNPGGGGAYSTGAAPGGNEDYFADNPETKGEERTEPEGDEHEMGETAIIPKSLLAGKDFKPGEEMVVKIVGIHGDKVEIAYAPEKGGEGEEPEKAGMPEGMGGGDQEMQSMMD